VKFAFVVARAAWCVVECAVRFELICAIVHPQPDLLKRPVENRRRGRTAHVAAAVDSMIQSRFLSNDLRELAAAVSIRQFAREASVTLAHKTAVTRDCRGVSNLELRAGSPAESMLSRDNDVNVCPLIYTKTT
jgi:hypothetical protein